MTTILFILVLVIYQKAYSQYLPGIQKAKCFGGNSCSTQYFNDNDDHAVSIIQKKDGKFMALCVTNSNNGDVSGNHGVMTNDIWIADLDSLFNLIGSSTYGGTSTDDAACLIKTLDGNYLFVATVTSTNGDVTGNHGIYDIWAVKINPARTILWSKTIGGSIADNATCVVASLDSGFVVSGFTSSNNGDIGGNHGGTNDGLLVKIDKNGNIIWSKCHGGTKSDVLNSVVATDDSCFIAFGYTYSNDGDVRGNHVNNLGTYASDAWLLKVDKNGDTLWSKCYGGTKNEIMYGMSKTFDNGFIVCGNTTSNDGDVSGNHNTSNNDGWVLKVNSFGDKEWQRCIGGTDEDNLFTIIQTADSNYLCANESWSTNGDLLGTVNKGYNDLFIVKLSKTGSILSKALFGGSRYEQCFSLIQTRSNDYVFAGSAKSNDGDVVGNHLASIGGKMTVTNDAWIGLLHNPIVGLPIELISFQVKQKKDKIEIYWSTASEISNSYFTIEKSIDGYGYQEIGQVSGAGNSNQILDYSFFDTNPSVGISYYRLSQTDYNGDSQIFSPVSIDFLGIKKIAKTIVYNSQGVEVTDINTVSGIYYLICLDENGNVIERKKVFKQ